MPHEDGVWPPFAYRWLIRVAGWIVPRKMRAGWRARREAGLRNWWVLAERGELASDAYAQVVHHCRNAFSEAFRLRLPQEILLRWIRSPGFVFLIAAVVLLITAGLSRGFVATRNLIDVARTVSFASPDMKQNVVVAFGLPVAFALVVGVAVVIIRRLPPGRHGWRFWSFLVLKTACVIVIAALVWFETFAIVRAHVPYDGFLLQVAALLLVFGFILAFGFAMGWSFADQRRRCPVCLRRLAMPVTIGTWGSVFEPVTTELLCEQGHGSLCLPENAVGEPDRWTELDKSWEELFKS